MSDICGSPTTESVLVEWAADAAERMQLLETKVQALQDLVSVVGIAVLAAWWSRCWCPPPKPYKKYKH